MMVSIFMALAAAGLVAMATTAAGAPLELAIAGDWSLDASVPRATARLAVRRPITVAVTDERHDRLPLWVPSEPGWARTGRVLGCIYLDHVAFRTLQGDSLVVEGAGGIRYERGKDYEVEADWAALGRLEGGRIGPDTPVLLSYRVATRRLDSVVLTAPPHARLELREGQPHLATPVPPDLAPGEKRLANVWIPSGLARLGAANLFPITETRYPVPRKPRPAPAAKLLPRTLAKLQSGEPLKILAWGDSVTAGYLGKDQWQEQFVEQLKHRFPKAHITLVTNGWGAHTSNDYVTAPAGHPCNYEEQVLGCKPDLVVSEFLNDMTTDLAVVRRNYDRFLADFRARGIEWAILTPHYMSEYMGLASERDILTDPRPLLPFLRQFAASNGVALADANLRWGRLWRQGLPFSTLMVNSINHPDKRGMQIFADSLVWLFP